jgi:hypothetical protein
MPIHIHGRTYKRFDSAVRAVMRWKRIARQRAQAYVAVVDRRQHGGRITGLGRRRGRGRTLSRVFRGRRGVPKVFRHVRVYTTKPRGYRWKVACGGRLVTYVKRKSFARDVRDQLAQNGRKRCRVSKA